MLEEKVNELEDAEPARAEGFPAAGLLHHHLAVFERALDRALTEHRQFWVQALLKRLRPYVGSGAAALPAAAPQSGWISIESLSRLRTEVGGRFDNLKRKWIAAGFPLREHKGDRAVPIELNQEGWRSLSMWILKQGFETRPAPVGSDYMFELRKVGK